MKNCGIILLLLALSFPTSCLAKEKLYWLEAVAPPFFIHEGQFKGEGYEDLITEIMKEQLPQFEHIHMQANISRHYQQWKQGENACSLGMFKTPERMEFTYFSIPSVFTLPSVLIIRKDRFLEFGGTPTVSLKDILESKKFVVGRSNNRSFGASFDAALDKYGDQSNIFRYEGPELSLNLFQMLLAGRIDALPGLPEEAMYLAEKEGLREQIMTIAVEENLNDHESMLSYVACSKTEWGRQTIEAINQVLLSQRPTERYRAAYERWLDGNSIPGYRQMYQDIFLNIEQ